MEHETRKKKKNKWKPRNLYTSNLYRFKIILGRVFHIPKKSPRVIPFLLNWLSISIIVWVKKKKNNTTIDSRITFSTFIAFKKLTLTEGKNFFPTLHFFRRQDYALSFHLSMSKFLVLSKIFYHYWINTE